MPRCDEQMSRSVGSQTMAASAVNPASSARRVPSAFEVIGNGEQRHLAVLRQPERRQHRRRNHHRGGAALHVRRARPVEPAVAERRAERLEAPRRGRRVDVEVTVEQERSRARRVAGDGEHVRRAGRSRIGIGDVDAGAGHPLAEDPRHRRQLRDVSPERPRRDDGLQESHHVVGPPVDVSRHASLDFRCGHGAA